LEVPEKNAAVGDVTALEERESNSLESNSSDLKKVLSGCPDLKIIIILTEHGQILYVITTSPVT